MLPKDIFMGGFKKYCLKIFLVGAFALSILYSLSIFPVTSNVEKKNEFYKNAAYVEVKLGLLSNKKANITLKISTQQAYGFVGEAETPAQKATVDSVIDNLKQNITTIVTASPTLGCKYNISDVDKFSTVKENYEKNTASVKKKIKSEYQVLEVDITLDCLKELPNQVLNVNFSQNFKNIEKILVDLKGKQKRKIVIDNSSGSFSF